MLCHGCSHFLTIWFGGAKVQHMHGYSYLNKSNLYKYSESEWERFKIKKLWVYVLCWKIKECQDSLGSKVVNALGFILQIKLILNHHHVNWENMLEMVQSIKSNTKEHLLNISTHTLIH